MNRIKIRHPQLGEADCLPSALHVWRERGWEAVEAKPATRRAARKASAPPAEPPAQDPGTRDTPDLMGSATSEPSEES